MLAGTAYGKVRAMLDDRGEPCKTGYPIYAGRDPWSEWMCRMPVRYLWQQTVIKKQNRFHRHTLTRVRIKLLEETRAKKCNTGWSVQPDSGR